MITTVLAVVGYFAVGSSDARRSVSLQTWRGGCRDQIDSSFDKALIILSWPTVLTVLAIVGLFVGIGKLVKAVE